MVATAYPFIDGDLPPGATPGINPAGGMPRTTGPADRGGLADKLQAIKEFMPPNEWERFKAEMSALPPEERMKRIAALATDFDLTGADAQTDMSRADALRQQAPTGRHAGGVYLAANPLEHLAHLRDTQRRDREYDEGMAARTAAREGARGVRQSAMARALRDR